MRCWTKLERVCGWVLTAVLLLASASVRAQGADELPQMRVYQQGSQLMLDARLTLAMPQATETVLRKGVPLAVVQEIKLVQPRWYWQDEVLVRLRREWTLSYQALTDSWRVMLKGGEQVKQFDLATDAWTFLTTMSGWTIGNVPSLGALRDAEAELTWSVDRRTTEMGSALAANDAGAPWRLTRVGRVSIPATSAPVRDAMPGGGQ